MYRYAPASRASRRVSAFQKSLSLSLPTSAVEY
jgi:hypothetical protein